MKGTTPEGARNEYEAAQWVRQMFGRVAHRYDLANHLLSFNMDVLWRVRTVRSVQQVLDRADACVLDICCGTGDLTLALATHTVAKVAGSDFCHPMLIEARDKIARRGARTPVFEADAMRLPVRDASLDLITVAFGFRNLANYAAGLVEMRRVLRPGGLAAILEFTHPPSRIFGAIYHLYCRRLLPHIGGFLTGSRDAYEYLPNSVRKFPAAEQLAAEMRNAGFVDATYEYMTGGIVALHIGRAE
jgi:demethylmenaquinone methyltransferase/2-methoxy-6-polyprenyl-1,4-benzoquinol methylase